VHVQVEDAALLGALAEWLAAHGWPVVEHGTADVDVLVPWDEDEFAAALKLRADLLVWRAAHGGAAASVDDDVWPAPRAA
jgi:hypothetical protein